MVALYLDRATVEQCLSFDACVDIMRGALLAVARGRAYQPLRTIHRPGDGNVVLVDMPAFVDGDRPLHGTKLLFVNLDRHTRDGVVVVFDEISGRLAGVVDAAAITAIRTAAVSALATDELARPDAADLFVLGTGTQAGSHIRALASVRPLQRIRVAGRRREGVESLIDALPPELATIAEPARDFGDARTADLIVTATSSAEPLLDAQDLAPGAHVCAVGSSVATSAELTTRAIARCSLFVDRRESALAEAGEIVAAIREGAITSADIRAEIGEVVARQKPGRQSESEITLFKSVGFGVQDLVAAQAALEAARAAGQGLPLAPRSSG